MIELLKEVSDNPEPFVVYGICMCIIGKLYQELEG